MLTQTKAETLSEQTRLWEEAISGLKFALRSVVAGAVVYTVLTVSPYLLDRQCLQSGYAPITLSKCLPEAEVKGTNWETTLPSPFEAIQIWEGKPMSQVLPLFIFLVFLSVAAMSGCFSLGRLMLVLEERGD